jgi:hypothetical protein
MGNGQMLETQQNLKMNMQSSDQNSSQLDLSSFNSSGSIKSNQINHNDIRLETKKETQIEKPNFGNLQKQMNTLNNPSQVGEANETFVRIQKMICIMFAIISIINVPIILLNF